MRYDRLDVGARREIFATNGYGGGEWIIGTLVEWSPDPLKHEVGYATFKLDEAGPLNQTLINVPMQPGSIGTRMRPISKR